MKKLKRIKYKKHDMSESDCELLNSINNTLYEYGDFPGQYELYSCEGMFHVRRYKDNWKDYRGIRRWLSFEHLFSILIGEKGGELFIFVRDRRENQPYYQSMFYSKDSLFEGYYYPTVEEFMNHLSPEYGVNTKRTAYEYTDYEGGPTHIWIPDYICL